MQLTGLILVIPGILMLFRPVIEMVVSIGNSMRGVKTEITPFTITINRLLAIVLILLGLGVIFGVGS